MKVYYQEHAFEFEPSAGAVFTGRLVLNDHHRRILATLLEAEDEFWYLDADGERLSPERLFALSPWSCRGPEGDFKLLCRSLDLLNGSVMFNTSEEYDGELFRWMR